MTRLERIAVAVVGASGYSGAEVLRLLASHPRVEVAALTANDAAGKTVGEVFPHLHPYADRTLAPIEELDPSRVDAAFVALPSGASAHVTPSLVESGIRVIDLGGDFRLPAEAY